MKRALCVLLTFWMMSGLMPSAFAADVPMRYTKTADDFRIRDPFVLLHGDLYYMYGTCATVQKGFGCFISPDLVHWDGPFNVFTANESFDGVKDFWAPECHFYKGAFYLFGTYYSASTGHRGTAVFRASSPLGPFEEISDGHVTPHAYDCIDGTLYVDEYGHPYIVYVREWTGTADHIGCMDVSMLSDDLSRCVTAPKELFRATDPLWKPRKITDGPFLYRSRTGKLLMLWSNSSPDGYCVALASADKVTGNWRQHLARLYVKDKRHTFDGGHGMLFTDKNGQLTLCIHAPNDGKVAPEHALFLPVRDLGCTLVPDETPTLRMWCLRALDWLADLLKL